MSLNVATLAVLTLLSSFLPGSGFVRTQVFHSRPRQAPARLRRPAALPKGNPTAPPTRRSSLQGGAQKKVAVNRLPHDVFANTDTGTENPSGATRFSRVIPLRVSRVNEDDIDPLEAGPDPQLQEFSVDLQAAGMKDGDEGEEDEDVAVDELDTEGGEEVAPAKKSRGRPARRPVQEDKSDAVSMSGLAGMVSSHRNFGTKRKRRDPLMPRGAPDPVEWSELGDMQEGGRAHLVIYHSGLEADKARAAKLTEMVSERYGKLVNVCEYWLDEEGITDEDRLDSNLFEVFLVGLDQVHYHSRSECWSDMTEEHMIAVTEDIGTRVRNEALLVVDVSHLPEYHMPGFTFKELMTKYPPL